MKKITHLATIGLFAASIPLSAQVATSFNVDLSPGTQNFAVNTSDSLTLTYSIGGTGVIALDANAPGGGAARWDQIDNATAGTTADAALFNTAFTLTYSGSANSILAYEPSYGIPETGAVLSTQQGNINALGHVDK